jgi:hypothetical protein
LNLVSLKYLKTKNAFMKDKIAANQNGVEAVNQDIKLLSDSNPPMTGPIMKPTPYAAPIRPNCFARSFGGVMSAIAA